MNEALMKTLEKLEMREPVFDGALHLFPLCSATSAKEDLFLLQDALQAGTLHVEELSESGSVPDLWVVNEGLWPVLNLEGEELIGAKQNRVVNSTVLVPAQ